jgi:hypothetical protein
MSIGMSRVVLAAAVVSMMGAGLRAQETTTATETKTFEVIAADGNQLIVRLPEGTRELIVPDDFRFMVNGQPLSVRQLKAGMKGTATVTTRTTVTPVTVTEVKSGKVVQRTGSTIVVQTGNEVKRFAQSDLDKRGMKIMRDGKPAQVSDFREGDLLTATIITTKPPQVLTEREVQATLAAAKPAAAAPRPAAAPSVPAAAAPVPAPQPDAPPTVAARTLPKTASSWPMLGLASILSLAIGMGLSARRRWSAR